MLTRMRGEVGANLGLDGAAEESGAAALVLGVAALTSVLALATAAGGGNDTVRYALTLGLVLAPFGLTVFGLGNPDALQGLLIDAQRKLVPGFSERLVRHEAGHLLTGYLLGLPVADYSADSVANAVSFLPLDPEVARRADEDARRAAWKQSAVFGEGLALREAKAPESGAPLPAGVVLDDEMNRLCVVSLAGVMSECLFFGSARGGYADLTQLQSLFKQSAVALDNDEQMSRVRWAAVQAYTLLRNHDAQLEALCEAMADGRSVTACLAAVETVESDPAAAARYREKAASAIAEAAERNPAPELDEFGSRVEAGPLLDISGDDVYVIAIGISLCFLVFAALGGVTL